MASSRKMAGGLAVFAAGALAAAIIVRDSRGWGAPGPQDAGPRVELPAPGARALADDLQELFAGVAEGVRRSVVSVGAKRVSEPPEATAARKKLPEPSGNNVVSLRKRLAARASSHPLRTPLKTQ